MADHVREQLAGIDVDALCADMVDGRRHCFMCRLPIAAAGQAELLLVLAPDSPKMVTLAHPACAPSAVIRFPVKTPELDDGRFEIECQLFGDDTPGIIVDCIGGQGVGDDGKPVDAVLEELLSVGFTQAGVIDKSNGELTGVREIGRDTLRAHLSGDRLTLLAGDKPVLQNAPLSFYPSWYHATRKGVLIAIFGRNLQGMSWEDLGYIIRAAETGRLVAAAMELTVTPPSRNRPCVCTPRRELKFKKCCGRQPRDD
ncbi:hypothetical protein [Saccharopolyspora sp. NPDC003762]